MSQIRFAFIVVLALVWGVLIVSHETRPDQGSSILLVVADDMGWTDLGCYGNKSPPRSVIQGNHGATSGTGTSVTVVILSPWFP